MFRDGMTSPEALSRRGRLFFLPGLGVDGSGRHARLLIGFASRLQDRPDVLGLVLPPVSSPSSRPGFAFLLGSGEGVLRTGLGCRPKLCRIAALAALSGDRT